MVRYWNGETVGTTGSGTGTGSSSGVKKVSGSNVTVSYGGKTITYSPSFASESKTPEELGIAYETVNGVQTTNYDACRVCNEYGEGETPTTAIGLDLDIFPKVVAKWTGGSFVEYGDWVYINGWGYALVADCGGFTEGDHTYHLDCFVGQEGDTLDDGKGTYDATKRACINAYARDDGTPGVWDREPGNRSNETVYVIKASEAEKIIAQNYSGSAQGESQTGSGKTGTGSSETETVNNGTKIFIGDSRTVGMHDAVYSASGSDSINKEESDGTVWVATSGEHLSWMTGTAIPSIEGKITNGANIIILMGVNDISYSNIEQQYIDEINKKAEEWKQKGANTYFVSVNPVDDSKTAKTLYPVYNSEIESFNNTVKAGLKNVTYIDTYSQIGTNVSTDSEGLHYGNETYKEIYNLILQAVNQGGTGSGSGTGSGGGTGESGTGETNTSPILHVDGKKYKIAYTNSEGEELTGLDAIEAKLEESGMNYGDYTEGELTTLYKCLKAEWATSYPNLGDNVDNNDIDNEYMQGTITIKREREGKKSELKYMQYDEFSKLEDEKALDYFSLKNGKLVIASLSSNKTTYEKTNVPADRDTYDDSENKRISFTEVDYKSVIGIHALPFEVCLSLLISTEDEKFVESLSELALEGKLELTVFDNVTTVTDVEVSHTHEDITYTKKINYSITEQNLSKIKDSYIGQLRQLLSGASDEEAYTIIKDEILGLGISQYYTNDIYNYTIDYDKGTIQQEPYTFSSNEKEEIDYTIKTTRVSTSSSYILTLTEADSWVAHIKNNYKPVDEKGTEEDLDTGDPYTYNEDGEFEVYDATGDEEVNNFLSSKENQKVTYGVIKTSNGDIPTETIHSETASLIPNGATKQKHVEGKYELTKNTTKKDTYKYEKESSEKKEIGTKFKKLYEKYARGNLNNVDTWLFEMLSETKSGVDYVAIMKYLLFICTGKDYGVTEEDIDELFRTFEKTGMSSVSGLYGSSLEEKLWFALKDLGFSDYAVAGVMGNIYWEGNFRTNNLEDSFESKLGMSDEEYTAAVDNGSYSREKFISDHTSANCGAGYGLVQWTYYSRKAGLYDYAKASGKSIADEQVQIDYLIAEITGDGPAKQYADKQIGNSSSWENATSVYDAAKAFCDEFENPKVPNYTQRASKAQEYYDMFHGKEKTERGNYTGTEAQKLMAAAEAIYKHCEENGYEYNSGVPDYSEGVLSLWNKRGVCCASFVAWVLAESGVVSEDYINSLSFRGTTDLGNGLKKIFNTVDKSEMQAGDIVIWIGHHTQMYAGNGYWYNGGNTKGCPVTYKKWDPFTYFSWGNSNYYILRPSQQ